MYLCIRISLIFGTACTSTAALSAVFSCTLLCVRTTDTFHTLFLLSYKVKNDRTDNQSEYSDNNEIYHYALPRAYSAFSFLFVLIIRPAMTPTKPATAARPAIAAPMLRDAGAVMSVPTV